MANTTLAKMELAISDIKKAIDRLESEKRMLENNLTAVNNSREAAVDQLEYVDWDGLVSDFEMLMNVTSTTDITLGLFVDWIESMFSMNDLDLIRAAKAAYIGYTQGNLESQILALETKLNLIRGALNIQ